MKKQNTATIVAPFPPPFGGMTVLAETLSRGLGMQGFEVNRVNTNKSIFKCILRIRVLGVVLQTILFYAQLPKILKSGVVLFISSSGGSFFWKVVPAALVCRFFGVATILDFVGGGVEEKLSRKPRLWKKSFSFFNEVVVPTSVFKDMFSRYGIRSVVLPHMVDVERFSCKKRDGGNFVLLAAKNLVHYSGVDLIIKAFYEVCLIRSDVELVIAGDGPDRDRLDCLVRDLGLTRVTFVGNVSYRDMPKLFDRADVFVHGTKYESFGIVLVEAFASGTPVVSTNVGGIPEVVSDGLDGYLIEFGDYRAMAVKIEFLLSSVEIYNQFSSNAIDASKKFSCNALFPRYQEVIKRAMLGKGK